MATVYRAVDTALKRDVALKMVHPHLLQQPETLKRFSNEARAIAALSHEHIIRIYDFGEADSQPFIVMEYIDGITLEDLIVREGTLPNIVTVEIALQILDGLTCAHKNGVYHRDIKPGNILIDRGGCLRITDFGIAYLVHSESITLTGSFVGSPHYISPEQVSRKKVQDNTDVFSLGIVLFQCLCGTVPFDAETPHGIIHALLYEKTPGISLRGVPVLYWFEELIEECLIKDPQCRPDAATVASRIRTACDEATITAGRSRLADFAGDPERVRNDESKELFSLCRKKARQLFAEHKEIQGVRLLEQAARFGELTDSDKRRMRRCARRNRVYRFLRRYVAIPGIVLLVTVLALFFMRRSRPYVPAADTGSFPAVRQVYPSDGKEHIVPVLPDTTASSPGKTDPQQGREQTGYHPVQKKTPEVDRRHPARPPGKKADPAGADDSGGMGYSSGSDSSRQIPETGFLECLTRPPWVNVYIDGIRRGVTPTVSTMPLASGDHILRLVKTDYRESVDTVTIAPSETTHVRIRLSPQKEDGPVK